MACLLNIVVARLYFTLVTTILCTALHYSSLPTMGAEDRPNIVLILADDLGADDPDGTGWQSKVTPNIHQLATQSLRFRYAYAAQPICSPSRAALMTGKCPARLHLTNYLPGRADAPSQKLLQPVMEGQLPLEEVTLPELLKQRGYATGLFGKWHLGGKGFGPTDQGFDVAVEPPGLSEPSATEGGKSEYAITRAAIQFIEQHQTQPFFCYIPHHTPHIRLGAKPELIEKHRDKFNPTYTAMLETLDDCVGQVLKTLDQFQLTENTIVIFTSDHGGLHVLESPESPAVSSAGQDRAGKGYLYDGGLRVPLYVRWPAKISSGRDVTETQVVLTDLVPTLLHAAGIDPAKSVGPLDGINLLPVFQGENISRTLFWHFPHYTNQGGRPAGAIRDDAWKLIEDYEDGSLELFHWKDDRLETRNLVEAEPERVQKMLSQLQQWRAQVGAQMPTSNPNFDAELHRKIYVDQDSTRLVSQKTAVETAKQWKDWRAALNQAIRGQKPKVTPTTGDIRLHSKDARIHAEVMRYEPEPHKNVLGYWTKVTDWADWEFDVPLAGRYEIEIQQGCGTGCGGSEVRVEVGGAAFTFIVQETGHFQHMILRTIGELELPKGKATLAIKPQTKPGPAVMDVRRVVLRPVAP